MKALTRNQIGIIGGLLLLIMLATRTHFINHIQDASWAIFFLLGFYLRSYIALPVFLLAAFALDLTIIQMTGGKNYCFTVSYPFLAPAYASLWLAGRWFAHHYSETLPGLLYFVAAAVIGITVCDVISSSGFYWFSGRFADTNVTEFAGRMITFLPMFMKTAMWHLTIAAVIHLAVVQASKFSGQQASHS